MPTVLQRLTQFFAQGRTARHVFMLASGTVVGQGLNVMVAPVLTRLYSPVDFGRNELFVAFLSVATVVASLRYDAAIVIARTRRTAAYTVVLSAALIIPMTALTVTAMHTMIGRSWFGFGSLPPYAPVALALAMPAAALF